MPAKEQLLDDLRERMRSLDGYLHSKELNKLHDFIVDIERGEEAEKEASKFMVEVPCGDYHKNLLELMAGRQMQYHKEQCN